MARPAVQNGRWLVAGAGGLRRWAVARTSELKRWAVARASELRRWAVARPGGRRRWLIAGAGGLALAAAIAYVATTGSVNAAARPVAQRQVSKPTPPAVVSVTPAGAATKVAPDTHVKITASGGTLTQVTVASG